jgi:iron complex outermembrane receptor protein
MKHYLLIIIILLTLPGWIDISAQTSLSGKVSNGRTGDLMEGATIVLKETGFGATTTQDGFYLFENLQPGKYTIKVSYVGFYADSVKIVIAADESLKKNFLLIPSKIEISPVVITATRTKREVENVPARMAVIGRSEIESYPANDVDDALKSIPNVFVNRSWGIFSKNTSVTMRGLDGTSRTLVLLDGIPLNKVSGGQIQWALIRPEDVETIEVLKGPGSALYGMNAMGGVINVKTRKPQKKLDVLAGLSSGSMNTFGGDISLGSKNLKSDKGFWWGINGFYRQGDGYILEPPETRDSTDSEAYLKEGSGSALFGYQFCKNHQVEISYEYHDEKRGEGVQVFESDGSYNRYELNQLRLSYTGQINGATLVANGFFQTENYDRQNESVNSSGVYRLYLTDSWKTDQGLLLMVSKPFFKGQLFTAALDFRSGNVDASDIYLTSTDEINYRGALSFTGIFLQDEINLANDKIRLIAGLRIDLANFYDGSLIVKDPTSTTGYPTPKSENFEENTWTSVSPKISGMYFFRKNLSAYLSFATGFNPPKLDDLCKSGKINKGFKLANPELKPETITTYEAGLTWKPSEILKIEPSVYFSKGQDFQYFVPTGDSIDTGGGEIKPVLKRENISEVQITGLEINVFYQLHKQVSLNVNYAWNHSIITHFHVSEENPEDNLEGNYLAEVPPHTAFAGLNWQNRLVNFQLTGNFVSEMWGDEENTEKIESYLIFDGKIWRDLGKHLKLSLTVQDIFDRQPIDKKLRLSPGRFFMGKLSYHI